MEDEEYGGCNCVVLPQEPHTCPFQEDVNNDSSTLCTCCADCANACAMDI